MLPDFVKSCRFPGDSLACYLRRQRESDNAGNQQKVRKNKNTNVRAVKHGYKPANHGGTEKASQIAATVDQTPRPAGNLTMK